ncbi:MAG: hypothetical protein KC464_29840, partial [Myxococcales bacterium]|nr:hypothetical protein [Myxococcales bacterium]
MGTVRGAVVLVLLAACGGASADRPLDVPLGLTRDRLIGELRRLEYCPGHEPPSAREVYEKCHVPGVEQGQSWVVAYFDGDRTVRLDRFERYPTDALTSERFNQLVEKRSAVAPPSEEARAAIAAQQELPAGTQTWVAFDGGDGTLVGVYMLTPRPPENATILEQVLSPRA